MFSKKFVHCAILALLFFVLSSPMTYSVVDRAVGTVVRLVAPHLAESLRVIMGGCPTTYGIIVHSLVFGVVAYYFLHRGA
jgi:hypothetical protein